MSLLFPVLPRWRRPVAAVGLGTVLTMLGACFGGDDAPPTTPTGQAVADTATAVWNRATEIDVLANDTVSAGTRQLAALAMVPAHGTAVITDGRIVYTPAAGFYGTDTLRYSLGTSAGTVTSQAEVLITVEAVLTIAGRAVDAPLAQAAVQISGAATAAATTDAQGAWQAQVRVTDPQGVLHIRATGSGAQAHVRLVGATTAGELTTAAAADGTVAAEKVEALTVSHFSTALAALAERAHGRVPGSATALAAAREQVDAQALLDLATLIHLVADEGLALPEGKADTWALAQDAAAVAALLAQQATADGAAFRAAREQALAAVPAAGALPTSGTLALYPAGAYGDTVVLTLAADGSAKLSDSRGNQSAHWVQDGRGLTLTLDAPLSETTFEDMVEPVSNIQVQLRRDTTALRLKRLAGGLVELRWVQTETRVDGVRAGEVRGLLGLDDPGTAQRLAVNPDDAAPLTADDFAVGKRWGGIRLTTFGAESLGLSTQQFSDILEVSAAGTGRGLRTGTAYSLQVLGAAVTVTGSDGSRLRYLRLGRAGSGAWHFATTDLNKPELGVVSTLLVPVDGSLVWDAAAASRMWRLDGTETTTALPITLRPDGSSDYIGEPASWQLMPDGRLRIVRPRPNQRQSRADWVPLARGSDGAVWVLRALFLEPANTLRADDSTPIWLVMRYLDTGPAN